MWKKCVVFCYGAKEITYIVESGRLVIRQSAIHIQFCQRVNARLCDHVIAARSQQVVPEGNFFIPSMIAGTLAVIGCNSLLFYARISLDKDLSC